ncbi:hypothetical protein [Pleomorphomonas oryzae]|uniref:hypothetical protein n=1 Tax=Pleomorphomonas oryzae TaxID=261934 RepID=UPI00047E933D|nr:hypothetical protein [Pleomorphomonas oryzae]
MWVLRVVSYIVLAIITAFVALLSGMIYDSPGDTFWKAYCVISFAALPAGFFFGQLGFFPYQSEAAKKLVYLPLAALAHLILFLVVASIFHLV